MIKEDNHEETKILIEQYKTAVELYVHEDNLNWTKLNHLFYINGGLWAVMGLGFKIDDDNTFMLCTPQLFMGMVSLTGIIVSLALGTALWLGTIYMQNRKLRVVDIEKALIRHGGKCIVSPSPGVTSFLRKSPTLLMLRLVPIVLLTIWVIILIVNITIMVKSVYGA